MMRLEECVAFSKTHDIPLITVEELRRWISANGTVPINVAANSDWKRGISTTSASPTALEDWRSEMNACSTCTIPVRSAGFAKGMRLQIFHLSDPLPIEVVAAIKGDIEGQEDVAVRIHSECFTGDVLRSAKCDCGMQLEKFFSVMEQEPRAVLLYIKGHEGRGIGLAAKFDAYRLQTEEHLDTVDSNLRLGFKPDLRSYDGIARIIEKLGIMSVKLFTNNPEKIHAVEHVLPVKYQPLRTTPLAGNREYLRTKEERMEHLATMVEEWNEGGTHGGPASERIEWPRFGEYAGFHVVLVATSWNKECSSQLVEGCEAVLFEAKCIVTLIEVPGALDLVAGCRAATKRESPPHAVVALGTYVRGDTASSQMHYQATVNGLQELNVTSPVPVISGVAFYNSQDDAVTRSTSVLGGTWAKNALQMISLFSQ